MENSDKVEQVKEKVYEVVGIPPVLQKLMYRGVVLEDGRTLDDYGIPMGSFICGDVEPCTPEMERAYREATDKKLVSYIPDWLNNRNRKESLLLSLSLFSAWDGLPSY